MLVFNNYKKSTYKYIKYGRYPMKLKEILVGIEGLKVKGDLDFDITNWDKDSRNIKENGLYFLVIQEILPQYAQLK